MKYSLRSLFIVFTLACVLLGGRIEYLRQRAMFHELEAAKIEAGRFDLQAFLSHQQIARDFRAAMFRPWTLVDENVRPLPEIQTFDPPMSN
ncbi:MAG: hypothetical protein ACKVP0_24350 [Pirellulaceae bacterium]